MSEILDSGARREFQSGAVRDIDEGKGRCDLLPFDILGELTGDLVLISIGNFMKEGDESYISAVINQFATTYFGNMETAILEVSVHYAQGLQKYGERNWEKGFDLHVYIDSGVRHYLKHKRGDRDEPHDRAFIWNMLGLLWTLKNKPELNDLPFAKNAA